MRRRLIGELLEADPFIVGIDGIAGRDRDQRLRPKRLQGPAEIFDPAAARTIRRRLDTLTDLLSLDRARLQGWGVVHALAWAGGDSDAPGRQRACPPPERSDVGQQPQARTMRGSCADRGVALAYRGRMIQTGHLLIAVTLALVLILMYLRRVRRYTIDHLAAIALFTAYLVGVAHYTVLPVRFDSGDELAGMDVGRLVSLVPFFLPGGASPSGQVLGNILLGVPFGFGLPFVHRLAPQKVAVAGLAFAGSIEVIQLGLDVLRVAAPPRSVDINDVVFNATGAALGVALFWLASRLYRSAFSGRGPTYSLWAHFHRTFIGEAQAESSIDGS